MKRLIIILLFILTCTSVYADDYQDGFNAMRSGDFKMGIEKFKSLAEQGHAEAQSTLGVLYKHGQGVQQNGNEAAKWFRKAAEQGHVSAQYSLAHMYYEGKIIPQNYKEAHKWYHKAAEKGYAEAQTQLSLMYYIGLGMPQDFEEAAKWSRMAAEQGDAQAQTQLGIMYSQGQGVPQDDKNATKWYRLAADQGSAESQTMLGYMYTYGFGVQKDFAEAVKWYRLAAEQGSAEAQLQLDKLMANMAEAAKNVDKNSSIKKNGDEKVSEGLLTDEQFKINGKSSIFLKCKTIKIKSMETDVLEFNPSARKLIWVEDNLGVTVNFPMEIEEQSDKLIRASYTMKQMFVAMEFVQEDLDQKQLAEFQEMKSVLNYFQKALPEKLIEDGFPPDESKKIAQNLFEKVYGFKQYVELDRYSGKIRWIQPDQKSLMPGGNDIKGKVNKGKCEKMEKKF